MTQAEVDTEQPSLPTTAPRRLDWLWVPAALLLASGLTAYIVHNIGNRYFWTDESSTFLTSLSWPEPGDPAGDWATMWSATMKAFLDPGLFHISSRLIALNIGTSIEVLRTFPLVFFGAYVVGLVLLFRFMRAPWFLAIGGTGLMLLDNITPYYALEFRPYSASLAAAVVVPLLGLWLLRRPRVWLTVVTILAFSILALMQYMVGAVAVATAALLLVGARRVGEGRHRVLVWVTAGYLVVFLPVVYALTRGSQLGDSRDSVRYTGSTVLRNQTPEEVLQTLSINFLSLTALPRTTFLVLVPLGWWLARRRPASESREGALRWIVYLWVYVVTATVVSASASALGVLPWVVGTRWSITEIGLIGASLAGLAGLLVLWPGFQRRSIYALVAIASVLAAGVAGLRLWNYDRGRDVDYLSSLAPELLAGEPGRSVIDYWIYPDVRYWLEYSGRFPALREDWIELDARMSPDFVIAGPADIERFLSSDDDRLLLATRQPLDEFGQSLPSNVRVITVPAAALNGGNEADFPVLLVKEPA